MESISPLLSTITHTLHLERIHVMLVMHEKLYTKLQKLIDKFNPCAYDTCTTNLSTLVHILNRVHMIYVQLKQYCIQGYFRPCNFRLSILANSFAPS